MKIFTRIKFLLLSLFVVASISSALAQVNIIQATNGQNIPVDKAIGGAAPGYTSIGTFTIEDQAAGQFAAGADRKIYIVPSQPHWQINPNVGTLNFGGTNITAATMSVQSNVITITYTVVGTNADNNFISVSGIEVQSTTTLKETTAASLRRSTAFGGTNGTINGFANNAVVAPLSETEGSFQKLLITMPGHTFVAGVGNTNTASSIVSNASSTIGVRAVDQYFNVVTSRTDVVQLTTNDVNAAFTTNNVALVAGVRSFTGARLRTAGNATTISASTGDNTKDDISGLTTVIPAAYSKLLVLLPGETYNPGTTSGKINTPTSITSGQTVDVQVRATDAYSNTITSISDVVSLSSNDVNATMPGSVSLSGGVATFNGVSLVTAGSRTLTANDATNAKTGTSASLTVSPGAYSKLLVRLPGETLAPGTATGKTGTATAIDAGTAVTAAVFAVDAYNNRVVGNSDIIAITSTDANATLPASAALPASGTRNFTITLRTPGTMTVTASNTINGSIVAGNSDINVIGGVFTKLQILLPGETADPGSATGKTGAPDPQVAGVPFTVRVRAVDGAWNLINGVTDVVRLTSTDLNATMPSDLAMEADGEVEFTVTLITGGNRTITASDFTDPSKTANTSPNVLVNAGAYAKLLVRLPGETLAPGTATGKTGTPTAINAGTQIAAAVFAVDAYNNRVAGNSDIIAITSNDANATIPASAALAASGTRNFNVTLRSPGTITVTASNSTNGSVLAGSSDINVIGGVFTKLQILLPGETADPGSVTGKTGAPNPQVAGVPFTVRVRAVDGAWNLINGVTDVVRLTSTDLNATMPADLAMEADGEIEFSVTLITGGSRTITASDFTDPSKTANTSAAVAIGANSFVKLQILLPGEQAAPGTISGKTGAPTDRSSGTAFNATVNAVDAYWNRVAVSPTIAITTTDGNATLPANAALSAAGTRNFSVTLRTLGSATVTATDVSNAVPAVVSANVNVVAGAFVKLQLLLPGETAAPGTATGKIGSPSNQVAGVPFNVTVNAVDAGWNVVTTINDPVTFAATNDIYAELPVGATLTNGVLNTSVTYRIGSASVNRRLRASHATATSSQSPAFAVAIGPFTRLLILLPGESIVAGHPQGKTGTPANQGVGAQFTITVRATDAAFNAVGGVTDVVNITSSDALATLPANKALVNSSTTFNVTMNTESTSNTLTASDVTDGSKIPYTTAGIPVYSPSLTTDFFRSNVTTGNWNISSSWQSSADGVNNWKPATLSPTAASTGVRVRNGHLINVTAALSIDDVVIENGGQVTLTTGNLTILNGAAATDFIVEGTLRANNGRTITTTGALQFASTGRYQHAYITASGTIPTANWATGSICEIIGYTDFAGNVLGSNQAFSDFVWNAPQTAAGSPSLLSGFSARNFTVTRTNSGTLNLGSVGGTTVITGNYVQTAGNVRANKTSGTQAISFGGNFAVNGGTFALGNGTVNVTYNGNSQSLSNAGTAIEFANVTFTSGGTKTLTSGNFNLATTGVLTMGSSTTLNANGNLTVLSNASNSGTIAAIPSGSSITGNVTVQRFVRGGAKDPFRTHRMFSSPIHTGSNTYNLAQLTDDILITGKSENGFHQVGNSGTSAWFYDPMATGTTSDPGFKIFPNTSTPVLAGRGVYILYRGNTSDAAAKVTTPFTDPENVVMDFTGTLNQQSVTVPLGYSAGIFGFNLLGNPYASSINWDNVISSGATSDLENHVIQIWDPQARQYTTYDGDTPANGGSNIISSGQGFFVRSKSGGGSFTFNESHKSNSMPPVLLMTTPIGGEELKANSIGKIAAANNQVASAPKTELRTWLLKENTPYKVESVVVFKDNKSADFVVGEDVPFLAGREVYMSSLTNDNQKMVINYMPAITATTSVKLDIDPLNTAGNYVLEVNYNNVPSGYLVKLTDNHLHTSSFVSNGTQHNFAIDKTVPASFGANRFSVSFEAPNTLPVTYSSFTAAKVNEGVQVKWSTATETNNDRFEVERAGDDKVFEKLQTVMAKGSGSTYSYIDRNPIIGNNYYRLVQHDKDGKNTTTDPQVVNFTGGLTNATALVSIFPNPVVSKFTVKFNGVLKANQQTLKIVSATGQVVLTKEFSKAQLLSGQDMDIASFASGVYIVEVYEGGTQRVGQMKLIKQ